MFGNDTYIPNNKAVSSFVESKVSGKQDKFTPATSITTSNPNSIPTNSAVSAFVDSKSLKYVSGSAINFADNTYTTVSSSKTAVTIDFNNFTNVKNAICRFTFTGTFTGIVPTAGLYVNQPLTEITAGTILMSLDNGVCIWTQLEKAN